MEGFDHYAYTLWIGVYAAAGLAGGWLFYSIWRRVLPAAVTRQYWSSVPSDLRSILTSEEPADLLRHYRNFIGRTLRHSALNCFALLLAIAPTATFLLLLSVLHSSSLAAASTLVGPMAPGMRNMELVFLISALFGSAIAAVSARKCRAQQPC